MRGYTGLLELQFCNMHINQSLTGSTAAAMPKPSTNFIGCLCRVHQHPFVIRGKVAPSESNIHMMMQLDKCL